MKNKYIITNILITSVFLICVIAMFISSIMWFNQINRKVDKVEIKNYVKEQASKEWFDYSYDISENIDENGNITYSYDSSDETVNEVRENYYKRDKELADERHRLLKDTFAEIAEHFFTLWY